MDTGDTERGEGPIRFPEVADGEDITLSATTFVSYERCPEQAVGRMRGIYGPDSKVSFVGGLAHRVFARHLANGPISEEGFAAACREEIGAGMNMKMTSLGIKPSQLTSIIEEVGELYDRFKTLGAEGFAGAEVAIDFVPSEGVLLRGSVDAVFDDGPAGVRLVDWKTAGLGDPGPQLAFYAMLWTLTKGEIPGRVEAVSVGSGERTEEVPTLAGVQETTNRVAEIITELRTKWESGDEFSRVAGPWCRWCPLLDECSEGQSAKAIFDA